MIKVSNQDKKESKNQILNINSISNDTGTLSFFESNKDIPFEIKRIYYISSVPEGEKRGMHAHKKLKQLLWCPYGEIEVELDDGKKTETFVLDAPDKGLLILKGYWRNIFIKKKESVLCVAASDFYSEEDYIRDYDEFLKYAKEGFWDDED